MKKMTIKHSKSWNSNGKASMENFQIKCKLLKLHKVYHNNGNTSSIFQNINNPPPPLLFLLYPCLEKIKIEILI